MRDIEKLHPQIRQKCKDLVKLAKDNGISIIVTATLRTKKEQDDLYAQGRTTSGMVVTNAKYPQSMHCWGLAFDIAVTVNGKVDWNRTDLFKKVGALGKTLGLTWGGDFKSLRDLPHFELPGFDLKELKTQYDTPDKFIAEYSKVQAPPPDGKDEAGYKDLEGHWAKDEILWLENIGIIQKGEKYRPDDPLSRAEAAVLIKKTVDYILAPKK